MSPAKTKLGAADTAATTGQRFYFASSYRYSTNDIVAPSNPCIFGFEDSMT